jgi:carboxyl-terminal processing protease
VDGTELKDRDFESVMDHLQGASGSLLALTYRKPGSNALLELEVERVKVKRPAVSYRGMLDERTGIVRLDRFTRGASGEVRKAVKYLLDSSGADQIILDLRGNGGGLLHEAVHIVGHFVAQGELVVETRGKTAEWDKVYETMAPPIADSIPLAVLIDPVSASASEIVAGTLQDLDRALIVGEESFGKGLVQQNKDLAYGTKVKVTVAKYYTPSGRCIQRLDYSGERNPDGTAEAVPDSLRRTFTTRRGRIVVDGTGVQPDLYVTQADLPEFLRALYQEQIPLAWLTQVYAIEDSLETADGFELSDMELGTCFRFIEKTAEEQAWSFGSELTDWLEEVGEIQVDNEAAVAEAVATLKSELAPGTDALLLRHRARLKKELEGDVLFMLAPREEAISHWLAQDLVTLEASKALVDGRAETLLKAP